MSAGQNQPQLDLGGRFDLARPRPGQEVSGRAVEVRRSARRRRTVSAHREGDRTVVMIPARMSRAEEREWVAIMLRRLEAQDRRRRPSDGALLSRARRLSTEHLDGLAQPSSVRWVTNQESRWGSCTPGDATIRLSNRLQTMPSWVIDYVLVHELAHLVEATHSSRFWCLVGSYPRAERARGYLEGVAASGALGRGSATGEDELADPLGGGDCLAAQDSCDDPGQAGDGVVGPSARR